MKILILGASGMLGSAVFKALSRQARLDVYGTLRSNRALDFFSAKFTSKLICGIDVLDLDALATLLDKQRPNVIINCVGLIKQHATSKDPLVALPINSLFPHRLAKLSSLAGARLIHVSTDCVFSGKNGMYVESQPSDAEDLYGKSKYIGELHDFNNAITIRTSIIGHELGSSHSLVDWFLGQEGSVKGFKRAIFSGFPTVEIAHIINDYILPKPNLSGLYHVSADAIDKYSLLSLVAKVYGKDIEIIPDESVCIDRSLDSTTFRHATGYSPPSWDTLVKKMYSSYCKVDQL